MNKKLKKFKNKNKRLKSERKLLELATRTLAESLKKVYDEKESLLKQKNALKEVFSNFVEVNGALEKRIEGLEEELKVFKTQE